MCPLRVFVILFSLLVALIALWWTMGEDDPRTKSMTWRERLSDFATGQFLKDFYNKNFKRRKRLDADAEEAADAETVAAARRLAQAQDELRGRAVTDLGDIVLGQADDGEGEADAPFVFVPVAYQAFNDSDSRRALQRSVEEQTAVHRRDKQLALAHKMHQQQQQQAAAIGERRTA